MPKMIATLLLVHDDAPLVLLVPVHDILHPALDLGRVETALSRLAHGNGNVFPAVVDGGDGADEELFPS